MRVHLVTSQAMLPVSGRPLHQRHRATPFSQPTGLPARLQPCRSHSTAEPATNRANSGMGRNRRRRKQRKANVHHWRTYIEDEQQEQSLDTQRQRELHFTCVNHNSTYSSPAATLESVKHFCSSYGQVVSVFQVNLSHSRNGTAGLSNIRSTAIELVVEMVAAADADRILQQRREVLFYNKQQGRAVPQLALSASFGLLRTSSCRGCQGRIGRACQFQRYCK